MVTANNGVEFYMSREDMTSTDEEWFSMLAEQLATRASILEDEALDARPGTWWHTSKMEEADNTWEAASSFWTRAVLAREKKGDVGVLMSAPTWADEPNGEDE